MIRGIIIVIALAFSFQLAHSQDYTGLRFGVKIPYSYNFGYYQRIADRWGAYGGLQAVTFPMGSAPVGFLRMFSNEDNIAEILREPFSIGAGVDLGVHYYFGADNRRYYFAINTQWINLLKRDITDDVVETAFKEKYNFEFDEMPIGPILEEYSKKPLTLNTHYLNLGLVFGYKFLLPYQPNWDIMIELELQKTIASHHFMFSDYRYITPVANVASEELKKLMRKSGWFPSLNVFFIYKLD